MAEASLAVADGATEIDIVMPVGKFLSGDYEGVCDEISEQKAACGEDVAMKVILETGAIKTASNIKKASILAMYAGADYIKTSTGKLEPAATPEAAYVMCQAIKEYYDSGRKVAHQQVVPPRHITPRKHAPQRAEGRADQVLLKLALRAKPH